MKTYFACMVFLIAGVLFAENPVAATSDEVSKGASGLLFRDSQMNRPYSSQALSLSSNAGTNTPANTNASVNVVNIKKNDKHSKPPIVLPPVDSKTNVDRSSAALSLRADADTDAPASTNASANVVSTKKNDTHSKLPTALLSVNAGTNVDHSVATRSSQSDADTNVSSAKKNDQHSKLPADSKTKVDYTTLASSLLSDAGTNAPAHTNVSVNLVTMETLDDKHRLAIGDRLSFRIEEDKYRLESGDKLSMRTEDEPTPLLVTDSGELEVPYIGRFPAENKTCKQLAYELKAALEKDYFYKATVILAVDLKTKSRGRVYLTGAVHEPGPQEIPSDEVLTLGKVILRAGGFTDFAERHNVKVTRKVAGSSESKTLVVDVAEVFDKGKTERDLPLESGDLIMVSERMIRF